MRLADGQSLLQKTFLRSAVLPGIEEALIVTNRELYFNTRDDYQEVNAAGLPLGFILEPCGRNTAPAIAAAALHATERFGGESVLVILPADHLIADQAAFAEAVARAARLADEGWLATFGIKPDYPETGYGYIEADMSKNLAPENSAGAWRVRRFVEKPDLEHAQRYIKSGFHLWNSGMFCFRADRLIEEMQAYAPKVLVAVRACLAVSPRTNGGNGLHSMELNRDTFEKIPDISIDYAVMEKSARVAVAPCEIGWNDIGSWTSIGDLTGPDLAGNRILGEVVLHDVSNCYIQSKDRLVGAVGVANLIIVDTPDALLVVDKDSAQDVRKIVAQLKLSGHDAYKLHRTVHRPWGTYTVLEEGAGFKIKRIEVKPGAALSLQMHHHRSEHWVVVSGMAKVVNGENEFYVNTNESTFIPAGHKHRLENPGVVGLVMIEVQSGEYLGEDDIVRFEDVYGRC
jgi:mannose-1-phosphate guanylyltransferase